VLPVPGGEGGEGGGGGGGTLSGGGGGGGGRQPSCGTQFALEWSYEGKKPSTLGASEFVDGLLRMLVNKERGKNFGGGGEMRELQ